MESSARSPLACSAATEQELFGDLFKGLRTSGRLQSIATCPPLSETIDRSAGVLMEISSDLALLRVLVLLAEADGAIAPEEQTMLQRICEEHLPSSNSNAWRDVASSSTDLRPLRPIYPSVNVRQPSSSLTWLFQSAETNGVSQSTLQSFTPSTPWSITSTSRKIKKSVL